MFIQPRGDNPAIALLASQGREPFEVAAEIVRRYSRHNSTAKSFWGEVQTSSRKRPMMFIQGQRFQVLEDWRFRRICELYTFYATCGADERVIDAVKAELH